jgi:response regulator RpfG family c-di-GMP phosphodiesterase
MSERILFVDDEKNALNAYKRCTRKRFEIATAESGAEGLALLRNDGPFAVIVADMRMPKMDGIQFLRETLSIAPDSVRMMLTGNHDLQTAMEAVNHGNVFRFLTKPCNADELIHFLDAGLSQHSLIMAEKELLEGTLAGTIELLTEMIAAMDPQLGNRSHQTRELAIALGKKLEVPDLWELDAAALLSHLGQATIPPRVAVKAKEGRQLTELERDMIMRVPEIGSRLLAKIPRLDVVAEIVLYEDKYFDGRGFPEDERKGEDLPIQSRILKVARDMVELASLGTGPLQALQQMQSREGRYDPWVLRNASDIVKQRARQQIAKKSDQKLLGIEQITVGMTLLSDVETTAGILLVPSGTYVSIPLYHRILNFYRTQSIREPIAVQLAPED